MAEFTGERVIPGEVNPDLWNEHLARYAFASRFAHAKRIVDVGCGAGYGAAQLAQAAANVIAIDLASAAVSYARTHYSAPNLHYLRGACGALPVASSSVDVVVSFELIEHVPDWREFLGEVRRVLAPQGQFIVSTPNKFYYGESRGPSGPNPFHVHEFEFEEFRAELGRHFRHTAFLLQNHADAIVFQPLEAGAGGQVRIEHDEAASTESHFFIAVCGLAPGPPLSTFVYVPRSANVLRERELHIHRLEGELAIKDQWLEEAKQEHQELLGVFRAQTADLEERNRWAEDLDSKLKQAGERVVGLQEELARQQATALEVAAAYESKVKELEQESARTAQWAIDTEARLTKELAAAQSFLEVKCKELEDKCQELAACVNLLHAAEATVEERTAWALRVQGELERAQAEIEKTTALLNFVKASRWVRFGRVIGLGPELGNN